MKPLVDWFKEIMTGRLGIDETLASTLDSTVTTVILLGICIGINWLLQSIFRWIINRKDKHHTATWHIVLVRRKLGYNILLLIPGALFYLMVSFAFNDGDKVICSYRGSEGEIFDSKGGTSPVTQHKKMIYEAVYEQEFRAVRQSAIRNASEHMNYRPICKRIVCNQCFLICDDLDMCRQCATQLEESGKPVLSEILEYAL